MTQLILAALLLCGCRPTASLDEKVVATPPKPVTTTVEIPVQNGGNGGETRQATGQTGSQTGRSPTMVTRSISRIAGR